MIHSSSRSSAATAAAAFCWRVRTEWTARAYTRETSAYLRPETEEGVYVVKDGKLAFDKVETGIAGELMIEVQKGPAVGQEIVTCFPE